MNALIILTRREVKKKYENVNKLDKRLVKEGKNMRNRNK